MTSLLCAIAPTAGTLVAARAVQGLAGALLTPAALAVIIGTFPPEERGAAIGTWTAWGGIASVAGPLVGGQLIAWASWRWVFLVNLPLVALTLALIVRYVPDRHERTNRRLDFFCQHFGSERDLILIEDDLCLRDGLASLKVDLDVLVVGGERRCGVIRGIDLEDSRNADAEFGTGDTLPLETRF